MEINVSRQDVREEYVKAKTLCDPYLRKTGFLQNLNYIWHPLRVRAELPTCDTSSLLRDHLSTIIYSKTLPKSFQNKLIILTGDSNDRNIMFEICQVTNSTLTPVTYNGSIIYPFSKVKGGESLVCVVRRGDFVLAVVFVFHFGVFFEDSAAGGPFKMHHDPESPISVKSRTAYFPQILNAVAGELFPEICIQNGIRCRRASIDSRGSESFQHRYFLDQVQGLVDDLDWTPTPDLVIAQSSLWDQPYDYREKKWVKFDEINWDHNWDRYMSDWSQNVRDNLLTPLTKTFGNMTNSLIEADTSRDDFLEIKAGKVVKRRWFVRTTPVASTGFSPFVIGMLNQVLKETIHRHVASDEESWGVLDWDYIMNGRQLLEDQIHQDSASRIAFIQMVLSKLFILDH